MLLPNLIVIQSPRDLCVSGVLSAAIAIAAAAVTVCPGRVTPPSIPANKRTDERTDGRSKNRYRLLNRRLRLRLRHRSPRKKTLVRSSTTCIYPAIDWKGGGGKSLGAFFTSTMLKEPYYYLL